MAAKEQNAREVSFRMTSWQYHRLRILLESEDLTFQELMECALKVMLRLAKRGPEEWVQHSSVDFGPMREQPQKALLTKEEHGFLRQMANRRKRSRLIRELLWRAIELFEKFRPPCELIKYNKVEELTDWFLGCLPSRTQ